MALRTATPGLPSKAAETNVDEGGVHGRGEPGPCCAAGGRAGSLSSPLCGLGPLEGRRCPHLGERGRPQSVLRALTLLLEVRMTLNVSRTPGHMGSH